MTNAERIKSMTDEELANFLCDRTKNCSDCNALEFCWINGCHANGIEKWLKQEVEDDQQQ